MLHGQCYILSELLNYHALASRIANRPVSACESHGRIVDINMLHPRLHAL